MTAPDVVLKVELGSKETVTLNHRRHHLAHARMVSPLRTLGYHIVASTKPTPLTAADLIVRIGWPNRLRRDSHNLMPTLKALIDGMTEAGLLPDDDDKHLTGPDLRPYRRGDKGRVHLTFEFTERAPLTFELAERAPL